MHEDIDFKAAQERAARHKADKLEDFLRELRKGRTHVYHEGLLCRDRCFNEEIWRLANIAWAAYKAGKITLTQRKLDKMAYQYIAVAR